MNKEDYINALSSIKEDIKRSNELIERLKLDYIEKSKTHSIGDNVTITLGSSRKVSGIIKSFKIFNNEVHVSSYLDGSTMKYITTPNLSVLSK